MWIVWLLIGVVAVVVWLVYGSIGLCPSCGVELPAEFGAPWRKADHCRCGWRKDDRV